MSKAAAKRAAAALHNREFEWKKVKPLFDYLNLLCEGPERAAERQEKRRRDRRALNHHLLIGAAVTASLRTN